ncbi:putative Hypothethical protein [uncultured Mycobacterium sp.]|uniref:Putative Hypothethical protein n=1 Tax=uncultured Mycobacterium sp. TaxID=171292 RepID=A0A1Y5PPB2_9MYCO|nr:putative Hypothethical protein [uncultured Mycobacterium sp.]
MPDDPPSQDFTWRFSMAFDGAALAVTEVDTVEMRTGPSDRTDDISGFAGFWYELRDTNDAVLFRRISENPMSPHYEMPTEDGTFVRAKGDSSAGSFDLLAPALGNAATLVIFGPDPVDNDQGIAAAALATVEL